MHSKPPEPDFIAPKAGESLELRINKSSFCIGASRECTYSLYVMCPTQITVIGGYRNRYRLIGDVDVLQQTNFRYLGGVDNDLPQNIPPDNIEIFRGVFE